MKELKILINERKYRIIVDKYKIFISKSFKKKFELLETIKKTFIQTAESEYGQENGTSSMLINEVAIDYKNSFFIEIHPFLGIEQFLKLTSKTLATKFVEVSLSEIEYDDLFQTLYHLYELVSDEIIENNTLIDIDDIQINYKLSPLSVKQLIKLLELQIVKDECIANEMDLTYEEKNCLYLKLIKLTAERNKELEYFVLFNCFSLNSTFLSAIEELPDNVYVLINAFEIRIPITKEKVYFLGNDEIDLMSEEDIYEKLMLNHSDTDNLIDFKKRLDQIFATATTDFDTNNLLKNI